MLIDQAGIARLLPHGGPMCLLDSVQSWDAAGIVCAATSHGAATNPLRRDGRLGILCGVEYAAQAMALHGVLSASGSAHAASVPAMGYLASLRALACHADRLDTLPGRLMVEATRLHEEADRAIYQFALRHAGLLLLEGRAAVVLAGHPP